MNISTTSFNKVAVFDVDGTLIEKNIGVTLVKYLLEIKEVKIIPKLIILISYPLHKIGILDFKYAILMGAWALAGKEKSTIEHHASKCFERDIMNKIYQQGIEEIKKKKAEDYHIVLATGAHSEIANVFGQYVGADHVVSTESEVNEGKYTLAVLRPLPYRKGKSNLVFNYISTSYPDAEVTVYTDEEKDLPMLKRADVLVGINADKVISDYVQNNGGSLVNYT